MTRIGLDLSMNSTGVCVNIDEKQFIYYIIATKMTNKMRTLCENVGINVIMCEKQTFEKSDDYVIKENKKTRNIITLSNAICDIITRYKPSCCTIEGVSYNSSQTSALADLAGLNYLVRKCIFDNDIEMRIISPMTNKKFACGIAGAEKDVMIDAFIRLNKQFECLRTQKIDDVADAYFLSFQ